MYLTEPFVSGTDTNEAFRFEISLRLRHSVSDIFPGFPILCSSHSSRLLGTLSLEKFAMTLEKNHDYVIFR